MRCKFKYCGVGRTIIGMQASEPKYSKRRQHRYLRWILHTSTLGVLGAGCKTRLESKTKKQLTRRFVYAWFAGGVQNTVDGKVPPPLHRIRPVHLTPPFGRMVCLCLPHVSRMGQGSPPFVVTSGRMFHLCMPHVPRVVPTGPMAYRVCSTD